MHYFFKNALLALPATTGLIIALAGFIMLKFPAKNINGLYGYRTPASMKNQARWDFSQTFAGRAMILWGVILLLSAEFGLIFKTSENIGVMIGLAETVLATIGIIVSVERAIKNKFGSEND